MDFVEHQALVFPDGHAWTALAPGIEGAHAAGGSRDEALQNLQAVLVDLAAAGLLQAIQVEVTTISA